MSLCSKLFNLFLYQFIRQQVRYHQSTFILAENSEKTSESNSVHKITNGKSMTRSYWYRKTIKAGNHIIGTRYRQFVHRRSVIFLPLRCAARSFSMKTLQTQSLFPNCL